MAGRHRKSERTTMRIFTITFIADATERAVSTAAGTAAAVLSAGAFNLLDDVPWYSVASVAAMAGLISEAEYQAKRAEILGKL